MVNLISYKTVYLPQEIILFTSEQYLKSSFARHFLCKWKFRKVLHESDARGYHKQVISNLRKCIVRNDRCSLRFFPKRPLPCRAKLCRAKFSSLNEKFVTFARRKVSPNKSKKCFLMKYKWTYEGNKSFRQILTILFDDIFVGRNYSSGEIFVTFKKIRHFRPVRYSITSSMAHFRHSDSFIPRLCFLVA